MAEEEQEESEEVEEKEEKSKFSSKLKQNPYMVSTLFLGIACLILILMALGPRITGNVISGDDAGGKLIDFAKSQGASNVNIIKVDRDGNLYKVTLSVDGDEFLVSMTRDGKYIVSGLIPLTGKVTQQPQEQGQYSGEDINKIENFVNCLSNKDFKIYGANWCGYTKKLVDTFGGFDMVVPIYIECTENQELCSDEGITGYPTIKIKGEIYSGSRTFEEFAIATGCDAPSLATQQTGSDTEASC